MSIDAVGDGYCGVVTCVDVSGYGPYGRSSVRGEDYLSFCSCAGSSDCLFDVVLRLCDDGDSVSEPLYSVSSSGAGCCYL